MKKLFIYCDTPPLASKGFGFSVLLYNILSSTPDRIEGVFTFTAYKNVSKEEVIKDSKWPVFIFFQNKIKLPAKFNLIFNELIFLIQLPWFAYKLRKHKDYPVMFCVGASSIILWRIWITSFFIKNDIYNYIVDDFETISIQQKNNIEMFFSKHFFRCVFKRSAKTIVISEGLKEKYDRLCNVNCELLLPVFRKVDEVLIDEKTSNNFNFVFSGGLNMLYNDSLQFFANFLTQLNKKQTDIKFRLIVQTYSGKDRFEKLDLDTETVIYRSSADRNSNNESNRQADCFLVPYSFEDSNKPLVMTSFPQKVAELIQLKRPLLIFGPAYGSVLQFFNTHKLSFTAEKKDHACLEDVISDIVTNKKSTADLIGRYNEAYENHFSGKVAFALIDSLLSNK